MVPFNYFSGLNRTVRRSFCVPEPDVRLQTGFRVRLRRPDPFHLSDLFRSKLSAFLLRSNPSVSFSVILGSKCSTFLPSKLSFLLRRKHPDLLRPKLSGDRADIRRLSGNDRLSASTDLATSTQQETEEPAEAEPEEEAEDLPDEDDRVDHAADLEYRPCNDFRLKKKNLKFSKKKNFFVFVLQRSM
jgi:hypothetical protein